MLYKFWRNSSRITAFKAVIAAAIFTAFQSSPLLAQTYSDAVRSQTDQQFRQWIQTDLWPEAQRKGISSAVFSQSLAGISLNWKLPDLVPPGTKPQMPKQQTQAEFGTPANYFKPASLNSVSTTGRVKLQQNKILLDKIEQKYGVPAGILLAVWGRESGFGAAKIPYNGFEVLATKAFMATRKEMFREELLAALEIIQKQYISSNELKTSWAGALGQPQFMPTSYLKHAVDFDGDGRRDIWNSAPDVLASIASYLRDYGWQSGRDWGFEVVVPDTVSCALEGPDQGKTITQWAAQGIVRTNGKPFPQHELQGEGYLLMPAGRFGPAFIVTPNFYVLKNYNMSDLYALFVGHVGDRIRYGSPAFSGSWGNVGQIYRSDVQKLQYKLQAQGYDVGKPDGLAGFKTRRSIGAWQQKNGQPATCFPNKGLLAGFR